VLGLVNIPCILLCFIKKNLFFPPLEYSAAAETSHHDFILWARNPPIKFYLVGFGLFCLYFFLMILHNHQKPSSVLKDTWGELFVKYNYKTKTHLVIVEIKICACIPFPPSFMCFLYSL